MLNSLLAPPNRASESGLRSASLPYLDNGRAEVDDTRCFSNKKLTLRTTLTVATRLNLRLFPGSNPFFPDCHHEGAGQHQDSADNHELG